MHFILSWQQKHDCVVEELVKSFLQALINKKSFCSLFKAGSDYPKLNEFQTRKKDVFTIICTLTH
jgi:hypothetical protein